MKRLPVLAFLAFSAIGVLAADQICPSPDQQLAASQTEQCPVPPAEQCQKKKAHDVSWVDWALGSHQMPGLHFVDLMELFSR